MNALPLCRICGSGLSPENPSMNIRKHEFEACATCADFCNRQPSFFPPGTERARESVQWWDLRYLYVAGGLQVDAIGSRPTSRDQILAMISEANSEVPAPATWAEMMLRRFAAKGVCVLAGCYFEGEIEEIFESTVGAIVSNEIEEQINTAGDSLVKVLVKVREQHGRLIGEEWVVPYLAMVVALGESIKEADPAFDGEKFLRETGFTLSKS